MHQRPAVLGYHAPHLLQVAATDFGGQNDQQRPPPLFFQQRIQLLQHQQVAPQPLAGHQPRHMREEKFGLVSQQRFGVFLQLAPRRRLLLQRDLYRRHPIVGQIDLPPGELRTEKAQLFDHPVTHGQHRVAAPRLVDQGVFEIIVLRTEKIGEVAARIPRPSEHVVEHDIAPRALLHQRAHRRHFVGVEHRLEAPVPGQHRLEHRPHAHEFVSDQPARPRPVPYQPSHPFEPGFGQAQVLLVLPDRFVAQGIQPEALCQVVFEGIQPGGRLADVDQQHLGKRFHTSPAQPPTAVHQTQTEPHLHLIQRRPHLRRPDSLAAVVEHLSVRP